MNKYSNIYVPIDLLWLKFGNKYEGLIKMINEAKQVVEITGDAPNAAIFKAVDKLLADEAAMKDVMSEVVKEADKEPLKEVEKTEPEK